MAARRARSRAKTFLQLACKHSTNDKIVCYDAVTALTERFRQNACSQGERRSVQRYFFTIRGRDRVEDDPDGKYLPGCRGGSVLCRESTIQKLRKKSYYNDPALMMIVSDEARPTAFSLPFFPGC
jgi:hypothetical protein